MNTGWIHTEIEKYREGTGGTYDLYPLDSLPPLPEHLFGHGFSWLPTELPEHDDDDDDDDDDEMFYMEPVDVSAQLTGLDTPESFRTFMSRRDLLASVPSNTSCWWTLSHRPIPSPLGDGATMLTFLVDQQSCVFWYLYLRPDGTHAVVAGGLDYDGDGDGDTPIDAKIAQDDLILVGTDFEQFIYRFWVENLAWFEAVQQEREWDDLSPHVREYLAHYRNAA